MTKHMRVPLTVLLGLAVVSRILAADTGWPKTVKSGSTSYSIYQPQPETMTGTKLTGRAAFSAKAPSDKSPVFGTLWFDSRLETNKAQDIAELSGFKVVRVRVPAAESDRELEISSELQDVVPKATYTIKLSAVTASLHSAEVEKKAAADIKHDPPRIVILEEAAVLLLFDGEPRLKQVPNTSAERVVNTAFFVLKDGGKFYLHGEHSWYAASTAKGPYAPVAKPTPTVAQLWDATVKAAKDKGMDVPAKSPASGPPPRVVVATEPTELISINGTAQMAAVPNSSLQYVTNTNSDLFWDTASETIFVLLSGRWYKSGSKDGPWSYVPPDDVPEGFKNIPSDSAKAGVKASVQGTDEARDAELDGYVPQTATVDRKTAKASVQWDGKPQFKKIENTAISYSVNSSEPVFNIDGRYYLCAGGIWYEAAGPEGPWAVSTRTPPKLEEVPPSNPYYNTKYVEVYDSTPDVVYVGYTPGYTGWYPYRGGPVWGTGWYYPPYWGGWYHPYHNTWGWGASYNPWTGWGFNIGFTGPNGWIGFGSGGFSLGFHFGPCYVGWGGGSQWGGGWCGPGGYYPGWGPIINNDIDIDIGDVNIGNGNGNTIYRPGNRPRPGVSTLEATRPVAKPPTSAMKPTARPAARPGTGVTPSAKPATVTPSAKPAAKPGTAVTPVAKPATKPGTAVTPGAKPATKPGTAVTPVAKPATLPNDKFAGSDGTVYQPTINGWELNTSAGWQKVPGGASVTNELNRDLQNRSRPAVKPMPTPRPAARPAPKPAPRPAPRPAPKMAR